MRTMTAPSTPLDGLSDQELWEFAQVVALVDESLAARVSFLTVVERHPFLRGEGAQPGLAEINSARSSIHEAVALSTKEHLVRAEAITPSGVDLEAVRRYCDTRIKAGHGRQMRYIF